jgi:drug/metabolite transporter (DMT)-like permease
VTLNIGIALAFVCAVVTQLGFLYKHRGANAAAKVDIRHPLRSGRDLFRSKWFAIGMAVALGAWLFHVAAMALAPISVVQAVLSTGVVIMAVMAERLFGFKVARRQWIGVGMTALGLVLLVITLPASSGTHSSFSVAGMIAFEAGMIAIGFLLISGPRIGAPDHHHGVMLGAAAGVLFGVSTWRSRPSRASAATASSGSCSRPGSSSASPPRSSPSTPRPAACRTATPCRSSPPRRRPPTCRRSWAASSSFGDPMPGDALGIALQLFAFALVIVAALIVPPPLRAARANAGLA